MMFALITALNLATAPAPAVTLSAGPPVLLSAGTTNFNLATNAGCVYETGTISGANSASQYFLNTPAPFFRAATVIYGGAISSNGNFIGYVSNGVATAQVTIANEAGRIISGTAFTFNTAASVAAVPFTQFVNYTNPALSNPTNCLVDYLISQLATLTNTPTAAANDYLYNVGSGGIVTINSNAAFYGVTNLMCAYIGQWNATQGWIDNYQYVPVSAHYCVSANHVHTFTSRIMYLANGTLYTNATLDSTNMGDLEVDLMSNTNPAWVRVLPDITPYYSLQYSNLPVAVREHAQQNSFNGFQSVLTSRVAPGIVPNESATNGYSFWQFGYPGASLVYGDYSKGDEWVGGDSSSPAWVILGNEAVLLGMAYEPNECPMVETNLVNAAIAYLSAKDGSPLETATPFPISNPKISP